VVVAVVMGDNGLLTIFGIFNEDDVGSVSEYGSYIVANVGSVIFVPLRVLYPLI
jgi:hypothetical protein